jgi:hypothetical protein
VTYSTRRDDVPTEEVLRELVTAAREAGEDEIVLEASPEVGGAWHRAGFAEVSRTFSVSVDALQALLAPIAAASFGSIQVQSDDLDAVVRAVRTFVPRLGRSAGSAVLPPRDGWIGVFDDLSDREPEILRRLARELSDRMGAFVVVLGVEHEAVVRYVALERGRVVDEYLSVPEYYGTLPPGEVIALGANPRLMARMTGADADAVRDAARTADAPEELPPARELLGRLAELFGVPGARGGYVEARGDPEAVLIDR